MRDVSQVWRSDHPWAVVYEKVSTGSRVGAVLWRIGTGAGVDELHRRARRELAALPDGSRVLDVPCGGGVVLRDLPAGSELTYVAADISPAMLDRTRREAARLGVSGQVETREADVQDLDDADDTYDLVLAFTSLHCFPDPRAAVHELARVLKPGARFVGSVFCSDAGLRFVPVHVAGRAIGVLGPGIRRADVRRWLVEAGFVDIRIDQAGGLTYVGATLA